MSRILRTLAIAMLAAMALTIPATTGAQDATPTPPTTLTCAGVLATPDAATGAMPHGAMHGSTPAMGHAGHGMPMAEFDLMYIDMMIPHHQSIIALAEVALPELTDPRLVAMAQDIIDSQSAESETLAQLRQQWYPGAAAVPMGEMMGMPGMSGDAAHMEQQMSAEWQVATFCAAENKDLAFIEQAIPHHQMAIDVSEAALTQATHPELKAIAQDVIDAQTTEIAELEAIRAELTGAATPAA
jgi:uncharacterized protein (DUF305 family)